MLSPRPVPVSRRRFLGLSAAASLTLPILARAATTAAPTPKKHPPIGLELYSVRTELMRNLPDTLRAVAKMGYEVVEFYSPYMNWTFPFAKNVRTQLDDLGLKCWSTHNPATSLITDAGRAKAIELNQILGSRHIVAASPPRDIKDLDGWKRTSAAFAKASEILKPHGLSAGYHNHAMEWKPIDGPKHIMAIMAEMTPPEFGLQLDVGTALEAGVDPVAWIKAHPGRIRSVHVKDWAPGLKAEEKAYRVLTGEGVAPWKEIMAAAESVGGVEFYLLEQEGARFPELETAQRCLENWKRLRGA